MFIATVDTATKSIERHLLMLSRENVSTGHGLGTPLTASKSLVDDHLKQLFPLPFLQGEIPMMTRAVKPIANKDDLDDETAHRTTMSFIRGLS